MCKWPGSNLSFHSKAPAPHRAERFTTSLRQDRKERFRSLAPLLAGFRLLIWMAPLLLLLPPAGSLLPGNFLSPPGDFSSLSAQEILEDTFRNDSWRRLHSYPSGVHSYIKKRNGTHNLMIYVGSAEDSRQEVDPLVDFFLAVGYDVITLSRPLASHPSREVVRDSGAFLQKALELPGYRKRIVMIRGKRLKETLQALESSAKEPDGYLVLKPELAPARDGELQWQLSRLPRRTPLLWMSGETKVLDSDNHPLAKHIPSAIFIRLHEPALSGPDREGYPALAKNDIFVNFILLQKYRSAWVEAKIAFPGGCLEETGGKNSPFPTTHLISSARPERDFCPLFLISRNGAIFRNETIGNHYCHYQISNGTQILRCRY